MELDKISIRRSMIDALMGPLCAELIKLFLSLNDWDKVRDEALHLNLPQKDTKSSRQRYIREAVWRLKTLSLPEIRAFSGFTPEERKMLLWIALCRSNRLAAACGMKLFNEYLNYGKNVVSVIDYNTLYSYLSDEYDDLRNLSDKMRNTLRQRIFSSAVQAELMDRSHRLIRKYPSEAFKKALGEHLEDLLVLPVIF